MDNKEKSDEQEDEPEESTEFDSGFADYIREIQRLRRKRVPVDVHRGYTPFKRFRKDFIVGHEGYKTPFALCIGPQGTGKSEAFRGIEDCKYVNNAASACGLYRSMYLNRSKSAMVLDDVDGLLSDDKAISLLKTAGDTTDERVIGWEKQNASFAKEGIPLRFRTKMRLCILANEVPKPSETARGKNIRALLGRVTDFCFFLPTAEEVHEYVATWFPKEHSDVHKEFCQYFDKLSQPSCRWYTLTLGKKRAGHDWRTWLKEQIEATDPLLWAFAEFEKSRLTVDERREKFMKLTGCTSKQSYYNYKKLYDKLRGRGEI